MSHTILTRTISAFDDKKMALTNAHASFVVGSSWTRIRIAMLFAFTDAGGSVSGTPRMYLGMLASPTASNSAIHSGTSHFYGMRTTATSWTRTAGTPPYYTSTVERLRKVGATVDLNSSIATDRFTASPTTRNVWGLELTKGSPFSASFLSPTLQAHAQADIAQNTVFRKFLEDETLSDSTIGNLAYGTPSSTTAALSEVTNGYLNAVHAAWDKTTPTLEISAIGFSVFA